MRPWKESEMKAVQIVQTGGPEVMKVVEIGTPTVGPDEVLIQLAASGVNFIDIYVREGRFANALPMTPGQEGAGTVVEVGSEVTGVSCGDRVAWCSILGTYAEFAIAPADRVVPIPDGISFEQAAAAMLQGMTAHYLSHSAYPIKAGDEVLIHAGAGGTGLLLTQYAKALGARVYTTVSTEAKAGLSREAGADEAINYAEQDFQTAIRQLTSGRGVAVVYDSVGERTFMQSLKSLRRRGTLVLFGSAAGDVAPFAPITLASLGSLFLTRPILRDYVATREELLQRAHAVFAAVADGSLTLRIGARFPLDAASSAHEALNSRRTTGKLLIVP